MTSTYRRVAAFALGAVVAGIAACAAAGPAQNPRLPTPLPSTFCSHPGEISTPCAKTH